MTHKTLAAAFVAAQANMKDPRLTGNNPAYKSKFVPRDEALDAVLDALHAEGLALTQPPISDEYGVGVRTILFHADSGESYDFGPFTVKPQKADQQGAVGATTYASRAAIMLICARAGDPDDDGAAASAPAPKPAPSRWDAITAAAKASPAIKAALRAKVDEYGCEVSNAAQFEALLPDARDELAAIAKVA